MLTQRQAQVLELIRSYINNHGHAPTLVELGQVAGIQSKGAVHRLVKSLEAGGYVVRETGTWRGLKLSDQKDVTRLPLLGRIAAGKPIEAITGEDVLDIDRFLPGPGHFALQVTGESMIDAGILPGDTVIVKQAETARRGTIVVALIDGQEATLKRLGKQQGGKVELSAENSELPPMVYSAKRVAIQGVVVTQMRSYQ